MMNRSFLIFLVKVSVYGILTFMIVVGINCVVDASSTIRPQHTKLAKLALDGNTVAVPENYNERVYQTCIVDNMKEMPETIVIGSSRGMYVGSEVTGYDNIYNNCVSGACLEDYYALIGLYYNKYHDVPQRVIIETSPWVFYAGNPEGRWREDRKYHDCACEFFEVVNGSQLAGKSSKGAENPYISLPYFRYNIEQWKEMGSQVFEEDARISTNPSEAADYPDGSIRYEATLENESEERLNKVLSINGACTYEGSNNMTEVDAEKALRYEAFIDYLLSNGTEVIIYMQPFSVTQCRYSFDEGLNPGYCLAYEYILSVAKKRNIEVHGGFDARAFGLTDNRFIDHMHLDRQGTKVVWKPVSIFSTN